MESVEAAKAAEEQRKQDSSSSNSEKETQIREIYKREKIEHLEWEAKLVFQEGTTFVGVLITPQHYIFINCGSVSSAL
jgi:hypothetical protein